MITEPDHADPLAQTFIAGWKGFNGQLIKNNLFMARIESSSAFATSF